MQKVIQRTAMAKRQAARKASKATELDKAFDKRALRKEWQQINRMASDNIVQARKNRREDWELGPLAPRRDVGEWREKYGTIEAQRMNIPKADPDKRVKLAPFAEGDRVVILKGRDKGKIGEVREYDDDAQAVRVKGLNRADVSVPEYMRDAEGNESPYRTVELKIPIANVRLVHALYDPATNTKRDVILNEVVRQKTGVDDRGNDVYTRFVPGTDITLKYPKLETPPAEDTESDTLRILSEEQTFVPTLLRPPMPPTVIDELRNKYSYFRDRHDPDYVARKLAEDAKEREKDALAKKMMTPLKELHARQRAANRAKGKQPLPEEALAKIGELMAAHKVAQKAAKARA